MNSTTIKFTEIPLWTYEGKEPSIYTFFEAIALADLEGEYYRTAPQVRLDDRTQKALLGANVFGKQSIFILKDGTVWVTRKVAFGGDFEDVCVKPFDIADAVRDGKKICAGISGGKFWARREVA